MARQPARTPNERLFDATIRRKVKVLRVSEAEAVEVAKFLKDVEGDLLARIGAELTRGRSVSRLNSLLVSTRRLLRQGFDSLSTRTEGDLDHLAQAEAAWEATILPGDVAEVSLETIIAAVRSPIQGLKLDGWMRNIERSTATNIERAVVVGVSQGETIDQIVARVQGTEDAAYNDGIMAASIRNTQALVRTAVSHVSQEARELVWMENPQVVASMWSSVLDGHTTPICQFRSGKIGSVGGAPIPDDVPGERLEPPDAKIPAHWQCRSTKVPLVRSRAGSVDLPEEPTYEEWLRAQPGDVQDEVLGPTKASMFRAGESIGRFVNHVTGRPVRIRDL